MGVHLRKISAEAGHTNSHLCLNLDEGGRTDLTSAKNFADIAAMRISKLPK